MFDVSTNVWQVLRLGVWCAVCARDLFLRDLFFFFYDDHVTESETIQSEHIRIPERENCG